MTILPKKKQTKEKNEPSTSDHPHGHQISHPPPQVVEPRHESRGTTRRPNSPPKRWGSPTPREDRLSGAHDPGGLFEDFAPHETTSGHNKRRHRSPHRNVRKHRGWDPNNPSTSGPHNHAHRHGNYRLDRPSTSQELNNIAPPLNTVNSDNMQVDELEDLSGYNSGDEYVAPEGAPDNLEQLEQWFHCTLKEKRGFIIKKMGEDGACLFRAVADQIFGDQEMHHIVRKNCMDYMAKNADFFRHYVTEDFDMYLNRKRVDNSHGNHVEIQAMCELYNRPIEVYQYSIDPINTFHTSYKTDDEPIRLSYHGGVHYNSVVNPHKATIGVGLGLPGFQPGLADKNQMRDAVQQSETIQIETTMLEDKLRETDWEVTQESIEEQVARESYLQWLRDQERIAQRHTASSKASATCSSASESQASFEGHTSCKSPDPRPSRSPRNRSNNPSGQNSPNRPSELGSDQLPSPKPADLQNLTVPVDSLTPGSPRPSTTCGEGACARSPQLLDGAVGGTFSETDSIMNTFNPHMYGFSAWDEEDLLAQVIAQSQQEYLDSLKARATSSSTSATSSPAGGASPNHSLETLAEALAQSKNLYSNSKGPGAKNS